MCGICGQVLCREKVDLEAFVRMRDSLAHRGPDGAGAHVSADGSAALGHRRLALVDLSPAGAQPMANEDATLWLSANGEIYNAPLLRAKLRALGHTFSSRSDSEVILHGYEEWGEGVLGRLSGMFALALWDERKGRLFLARDRFGIKPLYWCASPRGFAFASEAKALAANPLFPLEMDVSAACSYFVYRYVPSPGTIWKNVYKLPPGACLTVDRGRPGKVRPWYTLPAGRLRPSMEEAAEEVRRLLKKSVAGHLQSDVPVGSLLSGGYDSSALAVLLSDLDYQAHCFSIGFSGWEASEHRYARMVAEALGLPLSERILDPGDLSLLDELAWVYDEPLADISTLPTHQVSALAAERVKAVFSGEGADELFGGYTWQREYANLWASLCLPRRAAARLGAFLGRTGVPFYANAMAMGRFNRGELRRLLCPDLHRFIPRDPDWFYRKHFRPGLPPLRSIQHLDARCFMGELVLTKVDRASMAHSLEVRVPFLDPDLVDFALSLDESVVFSPQRTKPLLRTILEGRVPPGILARSKQGFVGPDSYYGDMEWYRDRLCKGALVKDGIVRRKALSHYLQTRDQWRLWKVLVFDLWYARWAGR
ncbi:MAG: asparagine synthase (glutamine-hydrolyzing) [Deltaproteobacteria bacterium]|nr:asparagine synthase (glutamine-hydrolyzing) [Deltaproteobacteria bacterium]